MDRADTLFRRFELFCNESGWRELAKDFNEPLSSTERVYRGELEKYGVKWALAADVEITAGNTATLRLWRSFEQIFAVDNHFLIHLLSQPNLVRPWVSFEGQIIGAHLVLPAIDVQAGVVAHAVNALQVDGDTIEDRCRKNLAVA